MFVADVNIVRLDELLTDPFARPRRMLQELFPDSAVPRIANVNVPGRLDLIVPVIIHLGNRIEIWKRSSESQKMSQVGTELRMVAAMQLIDVVNEHFERVWRYSFGPELLAVHHVVQFSLIQRDFGQLH